jgi:hypothetical protein
MYYSCSYCSYCSDYSDEIFDVNYFDNFRYYKLNIPNINIQNQKFNSSLIKIGGDINSDLKLNFLKINIKCPYNNELECNNFDCEEHNK